MFMNNDTWHGQPLPKQAHGVTGVCRVTRSSLDCLPVERNQRGGLQYNRRIPAQRAIPGIAEVGGYSGAPPLVEPLTQTNFIRRN